MKPTRYKVWIHIEGQNKDGDCIEGDDYFEPREAGCFKYPGKAISFRDMLMAVADVATWSQEQPIKGKI